MTTPRMDEIRFRLGELADVQAALALLHWDQEVYMPPKGAAARAMQLATLSAMAHRMLTNPALRMQLEAARDDNDALVPSDTKLVSETLYDIERATKLPEKFVHRLAEETSKAYEVWTRARADSDFEQFRPNLETLVQLKREEADLLGYEGSPYNALLEGFERGMTAERLKEIFAPLAAEQSRLVERIMASPHQPDMTWEDREWDEQARWDFTLRVLNDMGYDFEAGRQDRSVHPFTTSFDIQDVRVTTRFMPRSFYSGLMGSVHEGGHALYTQGHDPADRRTPLADGPSLGMHESQSRMWENMIGRSLPFWRHYAPIAREYFPEALHGVTPEQLYAGANRVEPSLIRVEADECTYNLHIILRFELELALLEGELAVADVPEAWNMKMKDYLGVDVPTDAEGCLQDIHWSHGALGYFPTYALGNLYAAQLFETIEQAIPDLWARVESGDFAPLLAWLREHVHRYGRRRLAPEIVRDATGSEPSSEPYLRYLKRKFGGLYRLQEEN